MSSEQVNSIIQNEVQAELERREYADPGDAVMAEYVMVLLNGQESDPVAHMKKELGELVGTDFTPDFVDWVFRRRDEVQLELEAAAKPPPTNEEVRPPVEPSPSGSNRIFASAVEGTKRKAEPEPQEPSTRRRLPDGPLGGAPTGPRSMRDRELLPDRPDRRDDRNGGRSLMDRLGPQGQRGPMPMRGGMGGRGGAMMNGRGPMNGGQMGPAGPGFQRGGFNQGMMPPGAQEAMMMQMMAMQANMQQMAQQMAQMNEQKSAQRPTRPLRGSPAKPPFVSKANAPSKAASSAIPDRPLSTALCKFGVGCTNARCTYSHPSPVADEKSGVVLSEEACEAGKECKDAECIKSHVSPAAVAGASTGPSRVLCKFQHCTNPSCQYRHEDAAGNFIPPPALSKNAATTQAHDGESRDEDVEVVVQASMDAPLDDTPQERPCRYAERCTRADCKFTHPASRPTPRGGARPARGGRPRPAPEGITGGMGPSRKFAAPTAESKLNPAAGEFKPAAAAEKELDVSM